MDKVHKPQLFWRERRAEAVSNRGPSAYQPNALPLGQTGSLKVKDDLFLQGHWEKEDAAGPARKF